MSPGGRRTGTTVIFTAALMLVEHQQTRVKRCLWALMRTDEATGIVSAIGGTVAPPVEIVSLLRRNGGDGIRRARFAVHNERRDRLRAWQHRDVTATGVTTGSSVTFRIANLNNAPGQTALLIFIRRSQSRMGA